MGKRRSTPRCPWGWSPPSSSKRRQRLFGVGSKVEVRSDEDGLRGGWFEANVTRILYKQRRYTVSHTNLVADDAFQNPIKESVQCSLIRPRPPPADPSAVFGIHQCVEAFHNEGWWPGVVCKLPKHGGDNSSDELYSVYFPATREEFQHKASELRQRLEWVKGKWVPIEEAMDGVHVMFGEGTRVEVSRDRENYGAAWFVGTVLKVIAKRYFLVEYENIEVDSDGGTDMLLKEIVDLQYIRPCPPASTITSFDVLDEVEGFHRDGWFAGVVTVILPGSRYVVKYKHQEDEMVLDHTLLRPGRVWDDDHWLDISRDLKVKTPGGTKPAVHKRKPSSGTISASASGNDDQVSEGSNFPSVRRKKEDGPKKNSVIKSSAVIKKSKNGNLSVSLSIPVLTCKGNDGETSDGSDVTSSKRKEAMRPSLEGGLELCESGKKLKAGNLLEESVSISKRQKSHASEQTSLSRPVLTSHNNESEVSDRFGVANLKDRIVEEARCQDKSSQTRKKSEKGKTLEKHLQSVDGTLMDCCSKIPATVSESSPAAMQMLERSPALVARDHSKRSPSHESTAKKSKAGSKLQTVLLSRELCHGQDNVNGTNESIITRKESYSRLGEGPEHQAEEANLVHLPVGYESVGFVPNSDLQNDKDNSCPTETTRSRRKLTIRPLKRLGKTPDIAHTGEVEEHRGRVTPDRRITFMNSKESNQLKEGTERAVEGEGRMDLVEVSNQMPILDVPDYHDEALESQNSLPTIAAEEHIPCSDGISLSHKQSDIGVDACITLIDSSILNAESRSLSSRGEEIRSCASMVAEDEAEARPEALPSMDRAHDQNEVIPSGSLSDKVVEMEKASIDPTPIGSSSPMENNICGEHEFSPSRFLSEGPDVEMKHALCNSTPCGLLLSNEDIHDHDELIPSEFPSGVSSSFVSRIGEIPNGVTELGENGKERGSPALPTGLEENIALGSDQLASAGPEYGVIFKSGETALIDLSPMELSSEKLALPFTKKSGLWELLESKEVFRLLPQQPHFHPLHRYDLELREGMAIGLMVTFATLVSDISGMRIVDSQHDFEVKLKTLCFLESHGFNIWSVHARLERLLQLRSRLIQLDGKKQSLGAKLRVSEEEKEQNSLLVFSVEQTMSKLEQKLAHLGKKRASVLFKLSKNESEIVDLKSGVQEAEEASTSTELEFNSVLAAPW